MSSANAGSSSPPEARSLRDIWPRQWKSGLAAWFGWTFDGLELHRYTLVALPFLAELLGGLATTHPNVGRSSLIIQGAFLLGWAAGGAFFGRIGDRLGRSHALSLMVLTYAIFTGLSFFVDPGFGSPLMKMFSRLVLAW